MNYKLKPKFLLIPTVLIILSGCASSSETTIEVDKKYPSEQLKEDLDFLFKTYEQVHPNLYVNTPKFFIDSLYSQLQNKLNLPITSFEFYKLVSPVVSILEDGHTSLSYPYEFRQKYLDEGGKVFPLDVRIDSNRIYVRQNFSPDSTLSINSEIISINGISAEEILIELRKYKSGESIGFVNGYVQRMFKPLLWTRYNFGDHFNIEYISSSNLQHYTKNIIGITSAELDSLSQRIVNNQQKYEPWTFQKLDDEKIAIVDMNSFGNSDDLNRFKNFLDSVFTIIHDEEIKNLIIDVRNNGGGDNVIGEALIDYLAVKPWLLSSKGLIKFSSQLEKEYIPWILRWVSIKFLINTFSSMFTSMDIDKIEEVSDSNGSKLITVFPKPTEVSNNPLLFKDNLFVLINNGSYSMSVMFAAVMKDYKFAKLIGEETGQSASPYGFLFSFNLPNTKLRASVPAGRSFRPSGIIDNRGVVPDFEIKQNPDDLKKKIDTVLEFTKQLIREK